MELLSYVNTIKKFPLPILLNKKIAVKIPGIVDMTMFYNQVNSLFTNVMDYEIACARYANLKDNNTISICTRIRRNEEGKVNLLMQSETYYRNEDYAIVTFNEIDYGDQTQRLKTMPF